MAEAILFFIGLVLGAALANLFNENGGTSIVFYDVNAIEDDDLPCSKGARYVPVHVQPGKSVGDYIADITV